MKKTVQILASFALGLALTANAQTQRIPLFEEWTGENCPPCASTNPAITNLANANFSPMKFILLRYQVPIPSAPSNPNSLYQQNPTEPVARQTYYYPVSGDKFAPQGRMDGQELGIGQSSQGHAGYLSQTEINNAYAVPSPFTMTTSYAWNATFDSITVTTSVTAAQNFTATSPLYLRVAICEEEIHYATAPGTNGEKDFEYIMRDMIPNTTGISLTGTWTNGQNYTDVQKVKLPTYIWNKGEVTIVAFVQEDKPSPGPGIKRDVHQSAYGQKQPLALDASVSAIAGIPPQGCSTTINPIVTVKNMGVTTLTSATINYKIDNGTVQTYAWTGNLATNATQVVNLPSMTTTPGAHTFYAYTSAPNASTDNNANNDQTTQGFNVFYAASATPVAEGFLVATFPPTNWLRINTDGGTASWSRVTTGNPTGSAKYDFYNNANTGDRDELVLPTLDISGNPSPVLTFDKAYNWYTDANGSYYDSLAVYVSTNCGANWTRVYYKGGTQLGYSGAAGTSSAYTPTAGQWSNESISLTAYGSQPSVLVKFVAINEYGNNLYVDNVNLNTSTGIKNVSNVNSWGIYPNPAKDNVNLNIMMGDNDNVKIEIYNSVGQVVYSDNKEVNAGENQFNINTTNFAAGMYSVILKSSTGISNQKLSISK